MSNNKLSCGAILKSNLELENVLREASSVGFDFVCTSIFSEDSTSLTKESYNAIPDLTLSCKEWNTLIVGCISSWVDLSLSDEETRNLSEKQLRREIAYDCHLSLPAIMLPLRGPDCARLAQILNWHLSETFADTSFWIQIAAADSTTDSDGAVENPDTSPWHWWNKLRSLCYNRKVGVVLELGADIPSESRVRRWFAEPIKAVNLNTDIFLTNNKGYPVLSKAHQSLVRHALRMGCQLLLSGSDTPDDMRTHWQYLNHLWTTQPPLDTVSQFSKGWEDYLQTPLQPLMDNLENSTYEIFEQDPIKYKEYENALVFALTDRAALGNVEPINDAVKLLNGNVNAAPTTNGIMEPDGQINQAFSGTDKIIVMVCGAGRGPLVQATLVASRKAKVPVKVYAVEKNINAVVTLNEKRRRFWTDSDVTIVSCDMRQWNPPEQADIVVSELLGSFGDNELSPECLDGAQRFLKPDGISIPQTYTSWLAPLQSQKLHQLAGEQQLKHKHPEYPFELPYVVRMRSYMLLDDPQAVFKFSHPNFEPHDNRRYRVMNFSNEVDAVVHGFAGYFDCILYKDIMLSITPATHSPGMFSWFSMYFPIAQPMFLRAGETLEVAMWRCTNDKNVWYEWALTSPRASAIHNPRGRSYSIGL